MKDGLFHILIVDDSPEDRETFRRYLSPARGDATCRFSEAESGEEGLRLCRAERPDCVLLDYNLPDLDGLDFLARLAGEPGDEAVPVVMLTGKGNEAVAVEALKRGAEDYLVKGGLASDGIRQAVQAAIEKAALRRQVEAQRRELERSAAALQDADRRKDEFLATLAHELRNPLAPIRYALSILDGAGDNREALGRAREVMGRQVSHMVRLIDDLLDVSRISRGKLELRKERGELAQILGDAIESCRPLIVRAGHELKVSLPGEALYVNADPVRVAQAFGNLLSNACKFTKDGGRISLTAERQGPDAVVVVADNGVGIQPDKLGAMFDMFWQAERTLEKSHGGLGIGLTLAKQLVEMHGGSIEARSEGLGRGSEFIVRLPVLTDEPALSSGPGRELRPGGKRRILVVDDNLDSAETLAALLELTGNETYVAHDGVEAVASAEKHRPDVILLDIGLPMLNGYEACRQIREQPWGRDIFIIALTGWGQEADQRKSREAGFDVHLVKPVDSAKLFELLASRTAKVSAS